MMKFTITMLNSAIMDETAQVLATPTPPLTQRPDVTRSRLMPTIRIPLHSRKHPGLFAVIDEEDYELVSEYRWNVQPGRNTFYAVATSRADGNKRTVRMHRLLSPDAGDLFIDHIDGDGLNNTKENLRAVSNRENMQNQRRRTKTSSKYIGVYFDKKNSKRPWKAFIGTNQGSGPKYLGRFATEVEAAHAYDVALGNLGVRSTYRNLPNVETVEALSKGGFDK